jgi:hypothetical protein
MRKPTILTLALLVCCLNFLPARSGLADVTAGDVIDKTNWVKAEGLLPESVVAWVKEGKVVLHIAEVSYEPRNHHPDFVLEESRKNAGKYAFEDDHWIVEKETGKRAEYIIGIPFPEIDPADPKAGERIMYNKKYVQYALGDSRGTGPILLIGSGGHERTLDLEFLLAHMEGNPKYRERQNPDGLVQQEIMVVREPYDAAGMAVMAWRFRDPNKQDLCFGYAPSIRRVRRTSPANRSDSLFGSDVTNDDVSLYDGKLAAMEWRLVRKLEALLPFCHKDPVLLVQSEQGEWKTTPQIKTTMYGYEQEGWQGAQWAPLDWVWVKRPTYVIEMKPKDRYYNYGIQHIWVDAEAYSPAFKVIRDRSGKYWKTLAKARMVGESGDKSMRLNLLGDTIYLDERANHATLGPTARPELIQTVFAYFKLDLFSLAGFQKFCK